MSSTHSLSGEGAADRRLAVAWWHPCITDYRHALFKLMAQRFALRLFLMQRSAYEPPAGVEVTYSARPGQSVTSNPLDVCWRDAFRLVHIVWRSDVFVSSFTVNTYTMLGLLCAGLRGVPVVVWEEMQRLPASSQATRSARLKLALLRWMARRVDAYFVLGEPQSRLLLSIGVAPDSIFRTGEVPADRFADIEGEAPALPLDAGMPVVLYLGRLIPIKGVDVLLRAFAHLQARMARPVALVLAGDGTERAALEAQAHDLGLRHVHFLGHVSGKEKKAGLLQRAQVLAVTSVILGDWAEGGPLVIPEALSAGTPVVCTEACGNTTDYVRLSGYGRVVPPSNVQALADALEAVLLDRPGPRLRDQALHAIPSHAQQATVLEQALCFAHARHRSRRSERTA